MNTCSNMLFITILKRMMKIFFGETWVFVVIVFFVFQRSFSKYSIDWQFQSLKVREYRNIGSQYLRGGRSLCDYLTKPIQSRSSSTIILPRNTIINNVQSLHSTNVLYMCYLFNLHNNHMGQALLLHSFYTEAQKDTACKRGGPGISTQAICLQDV